MEIIRPMTRWILLLFVFMLPAQLAWSATAGYCGHESAPVAFHLGHHSHAHKEGGGTSTDAATATEQQDVPAGLAHPDCGYCHASAAQLSVDLFNTLNAPFSQRVGLSSDNLYRLRVEPNIDRPKWTSAT